MKYLKKLKEEKIFKFSEYEPTKYNGNAIVTNIMEWLRAYFLDNSDHNDLIRIPLQQFLDETHIDENKLKTFIDEQEKTGKIESFKIKIEEDIIVFYDFKKDNSKKVWEDLD
jgi:hypothetical protein